MLFSPAHVPEYCLCPQPGKCDGVDLPCSLPTCREPKESQH